MTRAPLPDLRARLERLIDRRAVVAIRGAYDAMVSDLERRLMIVGARAQVAGALRGLVVQVRDWARQMVGKLSRVLGAASGEAQVESVHALTEILARVGHTQTRLGDQSFVRGVLDKERRTLLRAHEESMTRFGGRVVADVERELQAGAASNASIAEMSRRVAEVAGTDLWQAERIVATEVSYAFNATQRDAVRGAGVPGMKLRWTENCDDAARPLDDRVAVDSIAMHGQVVAPGELFVCPPTAPWPDARGATEVPGGLAGGSWEHPPNRPNDRSIVVPWMPGLAPGWRWDGARRVTI